MLTDQQIVNAVDVAMKSLPKAQTPQEVGAILAQLIGINANLLAQIRSKTCEVELRDLQSLVDPTAK